MRPEGQGPSRESLGVGTVGEEEGGEVEMPEGKWAGLVWLICTFLRPWWIRYSIWKALGTPVTLWGPLHFAASFEGLSGGVVCIQT